MNRDSNQLRIVLRSSQKYHGRNSYLVVSWYEHGYRNEAPVWMTDDIVVV